MINLLESQNINKNLIKDVENFLKNNDVDDKFKSRIPKPRFNYYGKEVLEMAITSILEANNLLLVGPKATGKNILCDNLAYIFQRPQWNISFHVNTDSESLIGMDTLKNDEVIFRAGPVLESSLNGGFCVFDEINMAKNDSVAIMHSVLDYRRIIDIPGFEKVDIHDKTRFLATMNYGYAGTREINEALLSRFFVINMPKTDEKTLNKILSEEFSLTDTAQKMFVRFFMDLQEKSLNSEISGRCIDLRGLLSSIHAMKRGLSVKSSLKLGIVNKTFDEFEKTIVQDIIDTIFKDDLKPEEIFE